MPKRVFKYKKAPGAPLRFTSAYMFFSIQTHKKIRAKMIAQGEEVRTSHSLLRRLNSTTNLVPEGQQLATSSFFE